MWLQIIAFNDLHRSRRDGGIETPKRSGYLLWNTMIDNVLYILQLKLISLYSQAKAHNSIHSQSLCGFIHFVSQLLLPLLDDNFII